MVQERPSDSTRPPPQGRRLGAGAVVSLSGVVLLLIFMIQNTHAARAVSGLAFRFALAGPSIRTRLPAL
jgi:hypothetical protein